MNETEMKVSSHFCCCGLIDTGLFIRKKADFKYRFRYNISFFIDGVVVCVLASYARDHGSIPGQVAFLVLHSADVKYNFFSSNSLFIDGVVVSVLAGHAKHQGSIPGQEGFFVR